jgi:hypothetical protein
MAYISGINIGTSIIETYEEGYTSELFTNPEYTDVFSAFTSANTITDKITTFKENNKTLEDIINERNSCIKPFDNSEQQAIFNFEKKKISEQEMLEDIQFLLNQLNLLEHHQDYYEIGRIKTKYG